MYKTFFVSLMAVGIMGCIAKPKGRAFCSTPLGLAQEDEYEIYYTPGDARVVIKNYAPAGGRDIDTSSTLCVFMGNEESK